MPDDRDRPAPPRDAPQDIIDRLQQQPPDRLEAIASYAEQLATVKRAAETESDGAVEPGDRVSFADAPDEWSADAWNDVTDDCSAPPRASVTVKEIDGRSYYYYQWREGDAVKSEYIAPVNPA